MYQQQIPTRQPAVQSAHAQLLLQHQQMITAAIQGKYKLEMQQMLLDHQSQKFNRQIEKLQLKNIIKQWSQKCKILQKVIDAERTQKQNLEMETASQKEEIKQLNKFVQSLKNQSNNLSLKIDEVLKQRDQKVDDLTKKSAIDTQHIKNKLTLRQTQLKKQIENLELALWDQKDKLQIKIGDCSKLKEENDCIKSQLENLRQHVKYLLSIGQEKIDLSNEYQVLDHIEQKLLKNKMEMGEIDKYLAAKEKGTNYKIFSYVDRIKNVVEAVDKQKNNLESKLLEYQTSVNQLFGSYYQDYLQCYNSELIESIKNKFIDLEAKVSTLKEEKKKNDQLFKKRDLDLNQRDILIIQQRQKIAKLHEQLDRQRINLDQIYKNNESSLLKIQKSKTDRIMSLQSDIKKYKGEISQLQDQFRTTKKALDEINDKFIKMKSEKKELESQIESIKRQNQQFLLQKNKIIEKIKQQQSKQAIKSQKLVKEADEKIKRLEKSVQSAKNQLQQNQMDYKSKLVSMSEEARVTNRQSCSKSQLEMLMKQLKQKQQQNEILAKEVKERKQSLKNKEAEINELQSNFQIYVDELENVQRRMIKLSTTYCLNEKFQNVKVRDQAFECIQFFLQSGQNTLKKNAKQEKSQILSIPCLSQSFLNNIDWIRQVILEVQSASSMETNFIKLQKVTPVSFNLILPKKNALIICANEFNATVLIYISKLGQRKTPVLLMSGEKKLRFPAKSAQVNYQTSAVNKFDILVLGKGTELTISKNLELTLNDVEESYFGNVDHYQLFKSNQNNSTIKITQMQVFEVVFK